MSYLRSSLEQLESEAIYILREVAAQFERPVLLFSGGKDSILLTHLARLAFQPARFPFPLLHIDTGHNFPETLAFRDELAARWQLTLLVRRVQDSIDAGRAVEEQGPAASRNVLQTVTLLDALQELRVSAAIGGARRDEEKARAKERIFSHRNRFGQWDPRQQRPELWHLYNGCCAPGEHFRIFPLSNWTELDIWRYIQWRQVAVPSLYFAHRRRVFRRQGMLLAESPYLPLLDGETAKECSVRFRTIGDMTCTGAMVSRAVTVDEILDELLALRTTERGTRADDQRSDSAMEDRKRSGYF